MIERNGDVFTTDATYIGHGVNVKGIMGAGIAKTIREKFPQVYNEYRWLCLGNNLTPGNYFAYPENGKVIVNFASQALPGPDATYDWLFTSLLRFSQLAVNKIKRNGRLVAIPEIGCGIGGLEWPLVKQTIELVEAIVPEIEYEVWHWN